MFLESLEPRHLMVADAINDAGTTNENTVLTTVSPGATTSLLANDTGAGLSVVAFSSLSAQGATVNVNPTGTFSYDPTTSTSLQSLGNTQSSNDTFAYVVSEGAATNGFRVNRYAAGFGDLGSVDTYLAGNPAPATTLTYPSVNIFHSDTTNQHFVGSGTASPFDDETVAPGLPTGDQDNYVVEATTTIWIPRPGKYTFSVNSDDGFGLSITGANLLNVYGSLNGTNTLGVSGRMIYFAGRGTSDTFGVWDFPTAGLYPLRLVNWEGGGGSSVEMYAARGDFTSSPSFAAAQAAGAQWRLVGDTFDSNGIMAFSPTGSSIDAATVTINVTGVNAGPVAVANTYATGEDTVMTVPVTQGVPGMNVAVFQGTNAGIASIDAARSGVPSNTGTVLLADFIGNGGSPHFAGGSAFPGTGGDNYGVLLTGTLRVTTAGTYTFGVNSDDASRIRIDLNQNGTIAQDGSEDVAFLGGCCADAFGSPVTLAVGDYPFEAMYTEGGGGDYGEFFYSPGTHTAFGTGTFRLIGDAAGGIASFSGFIKPGLLGNDSDEEASNGNVTQNLTVSQLNGGALTGTSSMGATVTVNPDGSFTYNPNVAGSAVQALAAGQTAVDTFTYTVSDNAPGGALTATATASITVTGANDLPTTINNSYTTDENTNIVTTDIDVVSPRNNLGDSTPGNTADDGVLVNDTDVDTTNVLEVSRVQNTVLSGTLGTLGNGSATATTTLGATITMNDNGTFTYNPATSSALQALSTGQSALDSFTYRATDGQFTFENVLNYQVYNQGAGETINNNAATADAVRALRAPNASGTTPQADIVGQPGGHFGVNTTLPGTANDTNSYAVYLSGTLRVTVAGLYTFGTFSDDNSRIRIDLNQDGNVNNDGDVVTQSGCCGDVFGQATLAVGDYAVEMMYSEGGGGDYGEFFYASGAQGGFNAGFRLLGDNSGPILAGRLVLNETTATVNITVNGINTAPVAVTNNYTATEDTVLNVPAIANIPGMNVFVYNQQAGETINGTFAAADTVRGLRAANFTGTVAMADIIGQPGGHFTVDNILPGTANNTENYAVYVTGTLRVATAGVYTFGTFSDDNSRIRIDLNGNGNPNDDANVATQGGCCGDVFGQATLAVGDYAFEAMYTEGGGGDYGEFFYAPGVHGGFNASFKLIGDASGGITAFSSVSKPGLLGNDSDEEIANGNPGQNLTVTQLNGGALTGTSAMGAQVTLNSDGSFTYNPNVVGSAVQALRQGQVAVDTFTYTVFDNAAVGGLSTVGTANITVTGRNDLTIANNNSYATNEDTNIITTDRDVTVPRNNLGDTTPANALDDGVLVNDVDIDNLDILEVRSVQGNLLSGTVGTLDGGQFTATTALGASVTMKDDGTFTYNPSGSSTLQNLGVGQTAVDTFTYTATDNQMVFTPVLNALVYNQQVGETISGTFATADTVRSSRAPNFTGTIPRADVIGQPGGHYTTTDNVLPGTANNTENYAVYINGVLRVTVAGVYTFGTFSDDNSRIRIDLNQNGNPNDDANVVTQGGCCGDVFGQATLAVGDYAFEAMYTEGGGGDFGEFFYAPGVQTSWGAAFRLIGDNSGPILGGSLQLTNLPATVNITVTGVNDNPVANDDGPFTTSENKVLTVTAAATPGIFLETYRSPSITDVMATADAARASLSPVATATVLVTDMYDPEGHFPAGNFPDNIPFPGNTAGDDNNYAVFGTGIMRVLTAGTYTFGSSTDDNSRIRIDLDQDGILEGSLTGLGGTETHPGGGTVMYQPSCCGNVFGPAITLGVGDYRFEVVYTEGGGGSSGEFFYAPGTKTAFDSTFRLIGDSSQGISTFASITGLMANDSDRDIGDTISVDTATIISANGATITPLANGSFTYNPATSQAAQLLKDGQTLTDTFVYTLRDSQGGTDPGTVTVVVTGVSDPVNDFYTVNEDNPGNGIDLTVPVGSGVLFNDALPGNPQFEVVRANATNLSGTVGFIGDGSATIATTGGGQVVIQDNGSFTYDQLGAYNSLAVGQTAVDTFTYVVGWSTAAGVVTTNSSAGTLPVSNNDLLTGLIPAVSGNTLNGNEGTSNNPAVLTNGQFGAAGLPDTAALQQTLSISNNTTLTYTLDTTTYPLGFDIQSLAIFSAWRDAGRDNIDVTAQYATVAAPGVWVNFAAPISFAPPTPASGQATITSPTNFLANGVGKIQFVFGNQENGYVGYRELDVIGTPRVTTTVNITVNGVNDAPIAEANGPYSINAGQNLVVNAAGSSDVDNGTVLTYRWDFDLDNIIDFTTTSQTATVPWQTLQTGVVTPLGPGSHTIRLTVSDGLLSTTDTATLNISDNFVYTPVQDGIADGYLLILNAAQNTIEIRDTATNVLLSSVPKAGTNQVTFTGTNDNDTLTIDYTNTSPIPAAIGVTFNSGAGTDGLVLRNGTVTTVTETYVTDTSGSTNIDGRLVNYTGNEAITDNLSAANRVFTFTGGNETVSLANLVAGTSLQVDSNALGAITSFNKPTDLLTMNFSTGSTDTLNINSATLTGNFSVTGSDGNDNVNVTGAVVVTAGSTLPGLVSITGNNIAFAAGSITTPNNVSLTATGAISTTTVAVDVNAVTLTAAAGTGIDLDTSVTTLNGTVSGAGNINFDEANAVTAQNVTTANGTITITTAAAGDVTVENVNSGTAATNITLNNGNLVSGSADAGVADIVAGALTVLINTGAHSLGTSAANRLEINAVTLRANIAGGTNNSAWVVDTAGGLQMNDSSMGATGTTVIDLLVQNGSLTSVAGGAADVRAIQVILVVTGATSTIGASAAAPLEINAATLASSARLDATTPGGATNHIYITDTADNLPIGTINAGVADVFLTSTTGVIMDDVSDAVLDITAGRLVLSAVSGIGSGATGNLETQVGSLEAAAGTGGLFLANTGNVTIGGISAAVGVSASGGDIVITSTGSIAVTENITATGAGTDVFLTTTDVAAAGQNITSTAGATISSAAGLVLINAGDDATLNGNLSAATTVTVNVDVGNVDPVGAAATMAGAVTAPGGAFLNGDTNADSFTVTPSAGAAISVNGNAPTVAPGDVLNLDLTATTNPVLTIGSPGSGSWSYDPPFQAVTYTSIEDVNVVGTTFYHLVLNANTSTWGNTNVDDLITLRQSGTDFIIERTGSNAVPDNDDVGQLFQGDTANILSFTYIGSNDNDIVTVNDGGGMLDFVGSVPGVTNNPNIAGAADFLFNGNGGNDALVYSLTGTNAAVLYAIGDGTGAVIPAGEVSSSSGTGTLLTYFTNVELTQSIATGTATLLGDSGNNLMTVAASGVNTRATVAGFVPLEVTGNTIGGIGVSGAAGQDTLELISIGTAQSNPLGVTLSGDADADTLQVHTTSGNTGVVTLNGGLGNDQFLLYNAGNTVDAIAGQVVVDGTDGNVGGNNDTLIIIDTGDTTADNVVISAVNAATSADYRIEGINSVVGNDVIIRNVDTLSYTATQGNDTLDSQFVNTVPAHDLSTVTVNGWLGADQFLLFTSDQAGGTSPTPAGVSSGVAVINLNGDAPGNPNALDGNDVFGQTGPGIVGTGSGNVGLSVPDTVRGIRPSTSTAININGGEPTGPAVPTGDVVGDVLNLDLSGLPANSAIILPTVSGVVAAGGMQPLSYAQIEDMNLIVNNQLINVQMGDTFIRGTAGQDLIQFMRNTTAGSDPNAVRVRVNLMVVDLVLTGKTLTYAGASNDYVTQGNVDRPAEIYGEGGDDYISGATGNDFLVGGLGSDLINAGGGDNVVWGDNAPTIPTDPNPQDGAIGGNDTLSGLDGNDVFYGGAGDDSVSAGGGNDYVNGGQGNDTLGGHLGDDRIYGGPGNDVLGGGAGNDLLSGGDGNDQLIGNTGNDVLLAGIGADKLDGGDGNDLLNSGSTVGENSTFSSVATTTTFGAPTYSNPADNDAALLTLLTQWGLSSNRSGIAAISHDGANDDLVGGTGDDDFVWETVDILDNPPILSPTDFNTFGMGSDERFGPTS